MTIYIAPNDGLGYKYCSCYENTFTCGILDIERNVARVGGIVGGNIFV